MSKTSLKERNKAIRLAWEREQQLVREGKGTRNWTEEQQKDILDPDKGKAYDENGRAFEGQHMKSAAEYPKYQGDPDNIQFLTRDEHLEAHKGSWQNPTNWYYNPETKEFVDFGENKYVPCKIIDLTDPIVKMNEAKQGTAESTSANLEGEKEKRSGEEQQRDSPTLQKPSASTSSVDIPSPKTSKSFGERITDVAKKVKAFDEKHPVATGVLKAAGTVALAVGSEMIVNGIKMSGAGSKSSSSDNYYGNASDLDDDYIDSPGSDVYEDSSFGRDSSGGRSSPEEHIVPAHGQHYHTKSGVIWKEKDPYPRGGKNDSDS